MKSGVFVMKDGTAALTKALKALPKMDVLVGIPEDKTERGGDEPFSNASIGYVAEFGAPDANIPQRAWLVPSIRASKVQLSKYMKQAGAAALAGKGDLARRCLETAGLAGQAAARNKVNEGIPPALAESTVAARLRRGRTGTKPLVDTGQFRNSISYVVRG